MGKKSKNTKKDTATSENGIVDWNAPTEMSQDEYNDLLGQVSDLALEEAQSEWMESCRYGEVDIIRALIGKFPDLTQHADEQSGNTGLHMAAANGHLSAVQLLVHHGHPFKQNDAGNTPLHWAASNGQANVVDFLTHQANLEVDVLEKNKFGRSALTEGFTSQNEGVVKALLEHDSATEEKLLSTDGKSSGEIVHKLFDKEKPLLVRELSMINADNPFADTDRPDQDTTGLSIWSASLVLARWLKTREWENTSVVELGAGCGVPGLAIAASSPAPSQVYVTDLNPKTVENIDYNIDINELSNTTAMVMDWSDKSTWPEKKVDCVVGSDLIYQKSLIPLLTDVVLNLAKPGGTFFYVAPDTGRDGLSDFIEQMKSSCPGWKEQVAPTEYHANPLISGDDEECFLHFQELSSLTYMLYEFPIPSA